MNLLACFSFGLEGKHLLFKTIVASLHYLLFLVISYSCLYCGSSTCQGKSLVSPGNIRGVVLCDTLSESAVFCHWVTDEYTNRFFRKGLTPSLLTSKSVFTCDYETIMKWKTQKMDRDYTTDRLISIYTAQTEFVTSNCIYIKTS